MPTNWITWREMRQDRWVTSDNRWAIERILYDGVWQWSLTRQFWHPKYPDHKTGQTQIACAHAHQRDALMDLVDEITERRKG